MTIFGGPWGSGGQGGPGGSWGGPREVRGCLWGALGETSCSVLLDVNFQNILFDIYGCSFGWIYEAGGGYWIMLLFLCCSKLLFLRNSGVNMLQQSSIVIRTVTGLLPPAAQTSLHRTPMPGGLVAFQSAHLRIKNQKLT